MCVGIREYTRNDCVGTLTRRVDQLIESERIAGIFVHLCLEEQTEKD
jgi:hypothetical protein